jgi:hypothetical protein
MGRAGCASSRLLAGGSQRVLELAAPVQQAIGEPAGRPQQRPAARVGWRLVAQALPEREARLVERWRPVRRQPGQAGHLGGPRFAGSGEGAGQGRGQVGGAGEAAGSDREPQLLVGAARRLGQAAVGQQLPARAVEERFGLGVRAGRRGDPRFAPTGVFVSLPSSAKDTLPPPPPRRATRGMMLLADPRLHGRNLDGFWRSPTPGALDALG